ncbi:MAG: hypothetical protein GEV12_04720 [Micromonosporaceae bacterium]|nr:hypothetical protein [Micromonosporaceae bacterium]
MHPRVILAAVLASLVVGGTVVVSALLAGGPSRGALTTPNRSADPQPAAAAADPVRSPAPGDAEEPTEDVTVEIEGFLTWAMLDRSTGTTLSSPNATETSSTESMIKVWIVADHLRRVAEAGDQPGDRDLRDARLAIRDSHNAAAQRLYVAGGQDAVVERMIDVCQLVETHIPDGGSGWWSRTQMSAVDAVRLGGCVADGTAAGPEWTDWLLAEMRTVRGSTADVDQRPGENFEGGRWGIIDGLPEATVSKGVAIKNGWTRIGATSSWHVNCLAITDEWVMAVMMRYPVEYSLDYGAQRCASVATQLTDDQPAPPMAPQ